MTLYPDLPVRAVLDDVVGTLDAHGTAVLLAPPGTGKTTLVPLALRRSEGKVVVAEPRRLATRAAAARMASLLGEPVGRTVGYSVRGDRKVSDATRIEVVTSGLLVRRLQRDPELAGVHTVLLDECHERHLDADLLLALLLDVRAGLRPDLRILATSATVAADAVAKVLGDAPVLTVDARAHSIDLRYLPPARGERLEAVVARGVRAALTACDGDVLAFLPGVAELRRTAAALSDLPDVRLLHGRMPAAEQDAVLRPGQRRRVVLSTAIAESSLTVPGVRAVVDGGRARVSRMDHRRGMSGLVTVRVSAAVADQRAGRAGREAPGVAFRCWPENEQATLPRYPEPEIASADLTGLALELACWGTPGGQGLTWWEPPPEGALAAAHETLHALGAVDGDAVTERGRRMAGLGLHPRLARALLDGAEVMGAKAAAEVVAILDDNGATSVDIERAQVPRAEARRLAALVGGGGSGPRDAALVVGLAYPERLARRRSPGTPVYLMAGGTAAELPDGMGDPEWLAVATVDRTPGARHGRIRLAARADRELAERAGAALLTDAHEVTWTDGGVRARHVRALGAIVLTEKPLADPPTDAVRAALVTGLRREGLGLLRWSANARSLRSRMAFLHRVLGEPWPDVSDEALLSTADQWLGTSLSKVDMATVLRGLLPWPAAAKFDELAPERLEVPSGSRIAVDYSGDAPALPVKVQEVFGWTASPTLAGVPVVLHLLSPAGRPAAVTADLTSFWHNGYKQVRADLRGRYPKHNWPADPMTEPPSRRTTQRGNR
ncbi:ATP-dependent helicase HrpB [Labedaea rhizosphaerae]|uniref:ATP-dependent helicase HrpB n=1 Tax=Labedaea rhizosphaerae TaxID=598644 RepID=A0A4R6RRW1_LABRH|nr:ATP-dependent helicase HrpB [Labedaea rhizosphaerae]TDP88957.1 ATP-dependent helicase HrpB [Labedaea rhizosphaerae]